jgi:hypothetical protein
LGRVKTFGVEIECYHPQGYNQVRTILRQAGCSAEWDVGCDGSGVEARTPVLQGEAGFKELRKGVKAIRDTGGYVTTSDGLHVHHGTPGLKKEEAVRLIKSWHANTPTINGFVAPRRRAGWPCAPWNDTYIRTLERDNTPPGPDRWEHWWAHCGPRGAINLHSLIEHETIELRLFEGTLHYPLIEAWVKFGQRFLNEALKKERKRPLSRIQQRDRLLEQLGVAKRHKEVLLAKAGGQADPTFQARRNDGW